MYLKQFGFQEKPFHITPNPRFIFLSKNHKDAFAHLLYGIQQRVGFLSLTGEVGTGKTTVLRTLLGQLEEDVYSLALILNPCLSALELMETIHREFSISYQAGQNLGQLHESLNRFLLEQRELGKTVVLVVDEAQNLQPSVLEQLRLLSNLETDTDKLIQMVLVGQPELEELFDRPDLRQLRQRLVVRYRLLPMDIEDSESYIRHRLKVAGWKGGTLFTEKSLQSIYRLTGGTPRLINILCDRALLVAYGHDLNQIDAREIQTAQSELHQVGALDTPKERRSVTVALALVLSVLISLGLIWPKVSDTLSNYSQASLTAREGTSLHPEQKPAATDRSFNVDALQQKIGAMDTGETLRLALGSLMMSWGKEAPEIATQVSPESYIEAQNLLVSRFQGDLDALLNLGTPALLELVLPMVKGSQYFALVGQRGEQVLLVPALTETGWIDREELEQVWFGKGLIPWINFDNLPYLVVPGATQTDVVKLQTLLRNLGFSDLPLSGTFDSATISAITTLQRQNALTPDGRVGPQTLVLIYRLAGYNLPELTGGEVL